MKGSEKFLYSVLLPVYGKDSPEYLKFAVDSMLNQTIAPEEIFIAVDGPISTELHEVIEGYVKEHEDIFTVHYYDTNRGIWAVLKDSLPLCRNEFIARMDADDYSVPTRIEKQAEIFRKYPELNVVGCNVDEFEDDINHPVAHVILPEKPEDVMKFARRRSPMRHPAMLYRKSEVISVGNYRNVYLYEDYELQARILRKKPGEGGGYIQHSRSPRVYENKQRLLQKARRCSSSILKP